MSPLRSTQTAISSSKKTQAGFSIVENLISLLLFALVTVGTSDFIATALSANAAGRRFSALAEGVHREMDSLRALPFRTVLSKFKAGSLSKIRDGETVSERKTLDTAHTTYTLTYTAVKTGKSGAPDAVWVRMTAAQRRGKLGEATYDFETIISQVK